MKFPQDDFSQLRRLLALKQHEAPPPGAFDRMRSRVLRELETDDLAEYSSWWRWLVETFDARPMVVCIYAVSVSVLLLIGFRIAQVFEEDVAATPVFSGPWLAASPASNSSGPPELHRAGLGESFWVTLTPLSEPGGVSFPMEKSPFFLNTDNSARLRPFAPGEN